MAHVQSWPDFSAMPTARTFYRKHAGSSKILTLPFMKTFPKDLHEMRNSQMSKLKAAKKGF